MEVNVTRSTATTGGSTTTMLATTTSTPPLFVLPPLQQEPQRNDEVGDVLRRPLPTTATSLTTTGRRTPLRSSDSDRQEASFASQVAVSETRLVRGLRWALFLVLLAATILSSAAVYTLTVHHEEERFRAHVAVYGTKIQDTVVAAMANRIMCMNALATTMTGHALSTNQTFPNVTLPYFELHGSVLRVQAQAHAVHYAPLIRNSTTQRRAWEAYAADHRFHIDESFDRDRTHRQRQDQALGYHRVLTNNNAATNSLNNETILDDGTGYRPRIWSNGAVVPRGDEPEGTGPYFPSWQRSPVDGAKQKRLNMNYAKTRILDGIVPGLLEKQAVINRMILPTPFGMEMLKANLAISQYRHETFETSAVEPVSFLAYPVLESFEPNADLVGVIASNFFWRLLFSQALPDGAGSFVCVLQNSFNQTMSYWLNGSRNVTFLGPGDAHDPHYEKFVATIDLNEFYRNHLQSAAKRSYTSVPLSTQYGRYTLKVYPTRETDDMFSTNQPWIYTSVVVAVAVFTSILFGAFVYYVERRQTIVLDRAVQNAQMAAATERDLNEYLAHEVRNPLSSAMLAHSFVKTSLTDEAVVPAESDRTSLQADSTIIDSSLQFIDEFLQSMLLMYRAAAKKVKVELSPTNLYQQVFKPVSDILSPQKGPYDVLIECHPDLVVSTDPLRLKQVLLNLGRNSAKFCKFGFVRFRAAVVGGIVELSVEDSGPGISPQMRKVLFQKYHTSLEIVTQGNGIGLALCKNLVTLLGGSIFLDGSYDSGMTGYPGARFVVKLNVPPIEAQLLDTKLPKDGEIPEHPPNAMASTSSQPPQGRPPPSLPEQFSVLFVDDDAVLRKLFMRSLRKLCPTWKIESAASGEAALNLVTTTRQNLSDGGEPDNATWFDLIFVDQYMATNEPRMTGCETISEMRARGIRTTICGLSANDMESEFLAAGADYFRLKPLPFEREALKAELLRVTKDISTAAEIPFANDHGEWGNRDI